MNSAITSTAPAGQKPKRYSDQELEQFRQLIDRRLNEAVQDYQLLRTSISGEGNGTDDTSPTFKVTEDLSDMLTREEMSRLAARREKYINELRNALIRIQNKTYGICRVTGDLIAPERLRSVPHTTVSIHAKAAGL